MNVLSISGILPIPGLITSNDFVFHTYRSYREQFPDDKIVIIRTTQYTTNIKKVFRRETELIKINKKHTWNIYDLRVDIFTFLSSRKLRNLHAILACSILLFNRRKLKLLMNENKFDVVHAQYIYPDGLLAYFIHKKYNIPYTITTHNELFYFSHAISGFIGKRILKNAFRVLPINFRNVNYFKGLELTNVEILPLGFSKSFIRQQKLPSKDTVRIVTVCELIPLKNVDKVLLAIASLINKHNIFYTVIGRGPEKQRLQEIARINKLENHVHFIEQIQHDQISDEMYKHDIFIMPSYVETFGRVYFEAMAMGIPVICAKNSGIHGYFKEMEEGVSVIHSDIGDISDKLEILITNQELRMRIGIQGQKLVEQYTWENIAKTLHSIYLEATYQ